MHIAIIGGGAAGFFSAITAKESNPSARVIIIEKSERVLQKVGISGGGRCNLTNGCDSISELCSAYSRGGKALKRVFHQFSNKDTIKWFESRGVPLIVENDLRVFPKSGNAMSIVECLIKEAGRLGIEVKLGMPARQIEKTGEQFLIRFGDENQSERIFDKIVITTGGSPNKQGLEWLEKLGHKIESPVPSLFSFNMPGEAITELMGVAVENAMVRVTGTKLSSEGPVLITHWGMSGPAILKLSSFGARIFHFMNYLFSVQMNWVGENNQEMVFNELLSIAQLHPKKTLANYKPFNLPGRLWLFILEKSETDENRNWGDIGKKGLNKLVNTLTNDIYEVKGQTGFKDEFVTCGGVSLESVDMTTLESRACKGLFFAGEILDIDAITGGFNLQAAWSTGYVAGKNVSVT